MNRFFNEVLGGINKDIVGNKKIYYNNLQDSFHWVIELESISFDGVNEDVYFTKAVMDTGTSWMLVPTGLNLTSI